MNESIAHHDVLLQRLAYAVRFGDMSLEAAIRTYSEGQYHIAEEYRKLAEEALACSTKPLYICALCARNL